MHDDAPTQPDGIKKAAAMMTSTGGNSSGPDSPHLPATHLRKKARRRPTDTITFDIPGSGSPGTASMPGTPGIPQSAASSSRRRRSNRDRHLSSLEAIRDFLRERSSYDVLPVSFRVVVLDTKLVVKPALDVLWQAGIISAPLWHSTAVDPPTSGSTDGNDDSQSPQDATSSTSPPPSTAAPNAESDLPSSKIKPGFAGMLTVNDIIHLIQYYYKFHASYDIAAKDVEHFRLESLRDIEQALQVPQPPLLSIDPLRPLYQACQLLVKTHARRLPLLDYDETTGMETVVSVLTQYRVLKFIAMNCRETQGLHRTLHSCGIGTYTDTVNIATATLDTTVFDIVHIFSEMGISAVPILDDEGYVVDMYETVDVITLVRTGAYTALDLTIRQALERRPKDFPGVFTCSPQDSLANIFALLRKVRFHRLLVLEPEESSAAAAVPPPLTSSATSRNLEADSVLQGSAVDDEELVPDNPATAAATIPGADARAGSGTSQRSDKSAPPALQGRTIEEELEDGLRTRKRGRLVGILCLSDLLRYIVGADEKDLGSALRQATA
ncbi:AMP-activated serine/threonine-protein kinase regulatory subunit [Tilletia horrida]|nr:AMP-activated serine/threonine-protein kinase regulatory subunit [Tilletia horrida]